ncbi:MAG: hypothetical protein EOP02_22795 [Proteobacteria bacterium]|nr:MAG: hypothetical protein EOP02_22795 [Pseudomonadota bacterium]
MVRAFYRKARRPVQLSHQKKSWLVSAPGYPPFPMIMPEDHDQAAALAFARCKWPTCTVE